MTRGTKDLISCDAISEDDLDSILTRARALARGPVRKARSAKVVGLYFEQKSTRTRLGFATAALRLGHHVIDIHDTDRSRAGKKFGESFSDHILTTSQYCDAIVVRSKDVGTPLKIAALSHLPVINAANGFGEHPTQALVDIFTIDEKIGSTHGLSIALSCDPRGRHALSFVKLLAHRPPRRFTMCLDAQTPIPPSMEAALERLRQVGTVVDRVDDVAHTLRHDVLSIQTQQMEKFVGTKIGDDEIDWPQEDPRFVLTADKILDSGSDTLILNPLPRQGELHPSCDELPNAAYFDQVRLSTFIRMAVLERMLSGRLWSGLTPLHIRSGWPLEAPVSVPVQLPTAN
jgi:aspartate carbamoyltransferase catalytic subunit